MKRILQCFLIFMVGGAFCMGQQALSSAGGDASGTGGTAGFTIGQTVFVSITGSGGTVSHGVQQPYEILVVTGITPGKEMLPAMEVYPNPVRDYIVLKGSWDNFDNLRYTLMDTEGKILDEKPIEENETSISMHRYPAAAYFLKVLSESNEVQIFKIIKSNQP